MRNTADKSYDDIINLPHHQSSVREHMSMRDRAAQFAPFAALTGYDDAVEEAARRTEERTELGEYEAEELDSALRTLADHISERPAATITYFRPDSKKSGGAYADKSGNVRLIDEYERKLIFEDGTEIFIDDIVKIAI